LLIVAKHFERGRPFRRAIDDANGRAFDPIGLRKTFVSDRSDVSREKEWMMSDPSNRLKPAGSLLPGRSAACAAPDEVRIHAASNEARIVGILIVSRMIESPLLKPGGASEPWSPRRAIRFIEGLLFLLEKVTRPEPPC
jgi:hypothetical protein